MDGATGSRDVAHGRPWSLHELLSVPFRIEAATVESLPGVWLRRAAYPELPGCTAEADTIEDALRLLERRRVEIIVSLWRAGEQPPIPRPPLLDCDPLGVAEALGLPNLLDPTITETV